MVFVSHRDAVGYNPVAPIGAKTNAPTGLFYQKKGKKIKFFSGFLIKWVKSGQKVTYFDIL
jgi:hypothetical protein